MMASNSNSTDSSKSGNSPREQVSGDLEFLTVKLNQLQKQIQAERCILIKEKVEKNSKKLEDHVSQLLSLSARRTDVSSSENSGTGDMLSFRIKNPLSILDPSGQVSCDDNSSSQEAAILISAKLPAADTIPPYTTWIFLARNQRMADDQSIIGRRHIYYDQNGDEALICSESEEELEEEKHEFSETEKRIIRMVSKDCEPTDEVIKILTQYVGGNTSEIHETYVMLKTEDENINQNIYASAYHEHDWSLPLDKSITASSDSLDYLFCRRCLVFDCRLHAYSETVITPRERQHNRPESLENGKPCSDHCYLQLLKKYEDLAVVDVIEDKGKRVNLSTQESNSVDCKWKPLEKELYAKGLEIFGKNSCLIARNIFCGLKTSMEVANYMYNNELSDGNGRVDVDPKEQENASRSRSLRKKGRAKKHKNPRKFAGHPPTWRRIADEKTQSCKQYTPCRCKSMCGKECPCLDNATYCEKYCGCSQSCKNRYRGCHCDKSQCRSRLCPCFAAGRECDPDVCWKCWVSGDDSLGEPPRREGPCGNMRLLLRRHQRILLGKSDVAGWGAFLKNSVNKNDYLGEYTGELISQREADKRGKIYDMSNKSFLYDLNDHYVLDAYHKGNKLKFANHSSNPNCYAKIMMVAENHRVGIFAKEQIEAGEELFYDYRYEPDQAPIWARKPDGSNRDKGPLIPQNNHT